MTIRRNTHRAQQVIDNARDIRCYSLSNGFSGAPLVDRPMIYGIPREGENFRPLVEVSQKGFLRHELENRSTTLSDRGNGRYTIHVHSNLWYEFAA